MTKAELIGALIDIASPDRVPVYVETPDGDVPVRSLVFEDGHVILITSITLKDAA